MSTAADEPSDVAQRASGTRLFLRSLALVASLASLFALWTGERARIEDDLQLFAEPRARPGETLALQALFLEHVDAPEGPTLTTTEVRVRLLDAAGSELAVTDLAASALDTMEGSLRVPAVAQGRLRLEASVQAPGGEASDVTQLTVSRGLEVSSDAEVAPASTRLAGPLQHLSVGELKATGTEQAPVPFMPRVVSGSCVPEQVCQLLVWVGEPASAVEVVDNAQVSSAAKPEPATETAGLVTLALRVHGAEAQVTLLATRNGVPVGERALRLPVALGEAVITARSSLAASLSEVSLSLIPAPGREHVILDTFLAGRWARSHTVRAASLSQAVRLDSAPEAFGLVRLQARSDRYSGEGSATRMVYVQQPGQSAADALAAVARAAREAGLSEGLTDAFERTPPPGFAADAARWASFALAPFEEMRMAIPTAMSGRPAQVARVDRVRTFVRFGVGAMLVCCAFVVGASVLRSGLSASDEAAAVLNEANEATSSPQRAQFGDRLWVFVWVLLVCMAFLAAALLVVAKPLWF